MAMYQCTICGNWFDDDEDVGTWVVSILGEDEVYCESCSGDATCEKCGEIGERRHHEWDVNSSSSVPYCDYFECEACDHQWGHN